MRMPEEVGFYCGACCGVCRIVCFTLYRKLCCIKDEPSPRKLEYNVICLGLNGTGKTTLLARYCGEDLSKIEPTLGFNMKDIILETAIIHVKEIGGAPNVRQYWHHYLNDPHQGIVFVINSSADHSELDSTVAELRKLINNPKVHGLPCLILATHQDDPNAQRGEELTAAFQLEELCAGRPWTIHPCVSNDLETIKAGFEKLAGLLWQSYKPEVEEEREQNRI